MITVTFFNTKNIITGFSVKGHAFYSQFGKDVVCSAVSSATYMAVNTITDVMFLKADVTEGDGYMKISMQPEEAQKASYIFDGLKLHLVSLSKQYSKNINVKFSEV